MWSNVRKFGSSGVSFVVSTAKLGFAIYFVHGEIGYVSLAYGPSMMPTINPLNDFIIVDVFSPKWLGRQYQKGDVIVSKCPNEDHKIVCKRIKALENETITVDSTKNDGTVKGTITQRISKGKAWFAGDNPNWSIDSRDYGEASLGLIKGRAVARFSLQNTPHFEWFSQTVSDKPFVNVTPKERSR